MKEVRRVSERLLRLLGIIVLILLWKFVSLLPLGPLNLFVSTPEKVAGVVSTIPFGKHFGASMAAFLLGFSAAILTIPSWVILGKFPKAEQFFSVAIHGLNAAPSLILAIVILLFFGIGFRARVAAVFLGAVFPLIYHTVSAVRETESVYRPQLDAALALGMKTPQVIRYVAFPLALPHIFAGLKQAVGRAFRALIGIEIFTSTSGLGSLAATYYGSFQIDRLYAVTLVVIAFTNLLIGSIDWLERILTPWRNAQT